MNDKIDNSGPAFPCVALSGETIYNESKQGMTLRDYFAAHALTGLLGSAFVNKAMLFSNEQKSHTKCVSLMAYEFADAMLEARK